MSSNILTALMPSFYVGLNKVQQEQTDLIDAVNMNASLEEAVIGQTITYPIAPVPTAIDTPQDSVPTGYGQTAGTNTMSISKSKSVPFQYNGEEIQQLQLGGIYSNYYGDQLAQAVRKLRKLVAADIVTAGVAGACRAIGTAGTTPFGTANVMTDFANANKLFNDNGSPEFDRHLILSSASVANVQGLQSSLFKANEAGTDRLLRTGTIGTVSGLAVGYDWSLQSVTPTGTSTATTDSTYAIGATTIGLTDTTSFVVAAGDHVYFGTDTTNVYVVSSLTQSAPTVASLVINGPGLVKAIAQSATVTPVTTAYTPNLFFTRDAITLIARQPRLAYTGPQGQLLDKSTIPDPRSGLTYQLATWQAGRSVVIEVSIAWGVGVNNPWNLGILLG